MDSFAISVLMMAVAGVILAAIIAITWASYTITMRTFLVKALDAYGGVITSQGKDFRVSKEAELHAGLSSLTIIEPNGTVRRFTRGPFAQPPIITVDYAPGWEE